MDDNLTANNQGRPPINADAILHDHVCGTEITLRFSTAGSTPAFPGSVTRPQWSSNAPWLSEAAVWSRWV
jgi:hypothetical protein